MFEAKVYRISVSTLGAILEENHIVKETILAWNNERAEETGKLFLTLSDGVSTTPDFYVLIIDSFIDTNKVYKIIASGMPVVLLFSKYHDPKNSIQTELNAVEAYRAKIHDRCACFEYDNKESLMNTVKVVLNGYK